MMQKAEWVTLLLWRPQRATVMLSRRASGCVVSGQQDLRCSPC